MTNNDPDAMDRLLDEALARYSSEEPLAGIEQRVINRIYAEGQARRFGAWRWVLAAGAAAALAVVVMAGLWKRPHANVHAPLQAAHHVAPLPQAVQRTQAARPRRKRRAWRAFPTPAPVSPEERALLAFVRQAPQEVREALREKHDVTVEPIQLERLKIEPLKIASLR